MIQPKTGPRPFTKRSGSFLQSVPGQQSAPPADPPHEFTIRKRLAAHTERRRGPPLRHLVAEVDPGRRQRSGSFFLAAHPGPADEPAKPARDPQTRAGQIPQKQPRTSRLHSKKPTPHTPRCGQKSRASKAGVISEHSWLLLQSPCRWLVGHHHEKPDASPGLCRAGKSTNAIAVELNARNVPTPNGGRWHAKTVIRVQRRLKELS